MRRNCSNPTRGRHSRCFALIGGSSEMPTTTTATRGAAKSKSAHVVSAASPVVMGSSCPNILHGISCPCPPLLTSSPPLRAPFGATRTLFMQNFNGGGGGARRRGGRNYQNTNSNTSNNHRNNNSNSGNYSNNENSEIYYRGSKDHETAADFDAPFLRSNNLEVGDVSAVSSPFERRATRTTTTSAAATKTSTSTKNVPPPPPRVPISGSGATGNSTDFLASASNWSSIDVGVASTRARQMSSKDHQIERRTHHHHKNKNHNHDNDETQTIGVKSAPTLHVPTTPTTPTTEALATKAQQRMDLENAKNSILKSLGLGVPISSSSRGNDVMDSHNRFEPKTTPTPPANGKVTRGHHQQDEVKKEGSFLLHRDGNNLAANARGGHRRKHLQQNRDKGNGVVVVGDHHKNDNRYTTDNVLSDEGFEDEEGFPQQHQQQQQPNKGILTSLFQALDHFRRVFGNEATSVEAVPFRRPYVVGVAVWNYNPAVDFAFETRIGANAQKYSNNNSNKNNTNYNSNTNEMLPTVDSNNLAVRKAMLDTLRMMNAGGVVSNIKNLENFKTKFAANPSIRTMASLLNTLDMTIKFTFSLAKDPKSPRRTARAASGSSPTIDVVEDWNIVVRAAVNDPYHTVGPIKTPSQTASSSPVEEDTYTSFDNSHFGLFEAFSSNQKQKQQAVKRDTNNSNHIDNNLCGGSSIGTFGKGYAVQPVSLGKISSPAKLGLAEALFKTVETVVLPELRLRTAVERDAFARESVLMVRELSSSAASYTAAGGATDKAAMVEGNNSDVFARRRRNEQQNNTLREGEMRGRNDPDGGMLCHDNDKEEDSLCLGTPLDSIIGYAPIARAKIVATTNIVDRHKENEHLLIKQEGCSLSSSPLFPSVAGDDGTNTNNLAAVVGIRCKIQDIYGNSTVYNFKPAGALLEPSRVRNTANAKAVVDNSSALALDFSSSSSPSSSSAASSSLQTGVGVVFGGVPIPLNRLVFSDTSSPAPPRESGGGGGGGVTYSKVEETYTISRVPLQQDEVHLAASGIKLECLGTFADALASDQRFLTTITRASAILAPFSASTASSTSVSPKGSIQAPFSNSAVSFPANTKQQQRQQQPPLQIRAHHLLPHWGSLQVAEHTADCYFFEQEAQERLAQQQQQQQQQGNEEEEGRRKNEEKEEVEKILIKNGEKTLKNHWGKEECSGNEGNKRADEEDINEEKKNLRIEGQLRTEENEKEADAILQQTSTALLLMPNSANVYPRLCLDELNVLLTAAYGKKWLPEDDFVLEEEEVGDNSVTCTSGAVADASNVMIELGTTSANNNNVGVLDGATAERASRIGGGNATVLRFLVPSLFTHNVAKVKSTQDEEQRKKREEEGKKSSSPERGKPQSITSSINNSKGSPPLGDEAPLTAFVPRLTGRRPKSNLNSTTLIQTSSPHASDRIGFDFTGDAATDIKNEVDKDNIFTTSTFSSSFSSAAVTEASAVPDDKSSFNYSKWFPRELSRLTQTGAIQLPDDAVGATASTTPKSAGENTTDGSSSSSSSSVPKKRSGFEVLMTDTLASSRIGAKETTVEAPIVALIMSKDDCGGGSSRGKRRKSGPSVGPHPLLPCSSSSSFPSSYLSLPSTFSLVKYTGTHKALEEALPLSYRNWCYLRDREGRSAAIESKKRSVTISDESNDEAIGAAEAPAPAATVSSSSDEQQPQGVANNDNGGQGEEEETLLTSGPDEDIPISLEEDVTEDLDANDGGGGAAAAAVEKKETPSDFDSTSRSSLSASSSSVKIIRIGVCLQKLGLSIGTRISEVAVVEEKEKEKEVERRSALSTSAPTIKSAASQSTEATDTTAAAPQKWQRQALIMAPSPTPTTQSSTSTPTRFTGAASTACTSSTSSSSPSSTNMYTIEYVLCRRRPRWTATTRSSPTDAARTNVAAAAADVKDVDVDDVVFSAPTILEIADFVAAQLGLGSARELPYAIIHLGESSDGVGVANESSNAAANIRNNEVTTNNNNNNSNVLVRHLGLYHDGFGSDEGQTECLATSSKSAHKHNSANPSLSSSGSDEFAADFSDVMLSRVVEGLFTVAFEGAVIEDWERNKTEPAGRKARVSKYRDGSNKNTRTTLSTLKRGPITLIRCGSPPSSNPTNPAAVAAARLSAVYAFTRPPTLPSTQANDRLQDAMGSVTNNGKNANNNNNNNSTGLSEDFSHTSIEEYSSLPITSDRGAGLIGTAVNLKDKEFVSSSSSSLEIPCSVTTYRGPLDSPAPIANSDSTDATMMIKYFEIGLSERKLFVCPEMGSFSNSAKGGTSSTIVPAIICSLVCPALFPTPSSFLASTSQAINGLSSVPYENDRATTDAASASAMRRAYITDMIHRIVAPLCDLDGTDLATILAKPHTSKESAGIEAEGELSSSQKSEITQEKEEITIGSTNRILQDRDRSLYRLAGTSSLLSTSTTTTTMLMTIPMPHIFGYSCASMIRIPTAIAKLMTIDFFSSFRRRKVVIPAKGLGGAISTSQISAESVKNVFHSAFASKGSLVRVNDCDFQQPENLAFENKKKTLFSWSPRDLHFFEHPTIGLFPRYSVYWKDPNSSQPFSAAASASARDLAAKVQRVAGLSAVPHSSPTSPQKDADRVWVPLAIHEDGAIVARHFIMSKFDKTPRSFFEFHVELRQPREISEGTVTTLSPRLIARRMLGECVVVHSLNRCQWHDTDPQQHNMFLAQNYLAPHLNVKEVVKAKTKFDAEYYLLVSRKQQQQRESNNGSSSNNNKKAEEINERRGGGRFYAQTKIGSTNSFTSSYMYSISMQKAANHSSASHPPSPPPTAEEVLTTAAPFYEPAFVVVHTLYSAKVMNSTTGYITIASSCGFPITRRKTVSEPPTPSHSDHAATTSEKKEEAQMANTTGESLPAPGVHIIGNNKTCKGLDHIAVSASSAANSTARSLFLAHYPTAYEYSESISIAGKHIIHNKELRLRLGWDRVAFTFPRTSNFSMNKQTSSTAVNNRRGQHNDKSNEEEDRCECLFTAYSSSGNRNYNGISSNNNNNNNNNTFTLSAKGPNHFLAFTRCVDAVLEAIAEKLLEEAALAGESMLGTSSAQKHSSSSSKRVASIAAGQQAKAIVLEDDDDDMDLLADAAISFTTTTTAADGSEDLDGDGAVAMDTTATPTPTTGNCAVIAGCGTPQMTEEYEDDNDDYYDGTTREVNARGCGRQGAGYSTASGMKKKQHMYTAEEIAKMTLKNHKFEKPLLHQIHALLRKLRGNDDEKYKIYLTSAATPSDQGVLSVALPNERNIDGATEGENARVRLDLVALSPAAQHIPTIDNTGSSSNKHKGSNTTARSRQGEGSGMVANGEVLLETVSTDEEGVFESIFELYKKATVRLASSYSPLPSASPSNTGKIEVRTFPSRDSYDEIVKTINANLAKHDSLGTAFWKTQQYLSDSLVMTDEANVIYQHDHTQWCASIYVPLAPLGVVVVRSSSSSPSRPTVAVDDGSSANATKSDSAGILVTGEAKRGKKEALVSALERISHASGLNIASSSTDASYSSSLPSSLLSLPPSPASTGNPQKIRNYGGHTCNGGGGGSSNLPHTEERTKTSSSHTTQFSPDSVARGRPTVNELLSLNRRHSSLLDAVVSIATGRVNRAHPNSSINFIASDFGIDLYLMAATSSLQEQRVQQLSNATLLWRSNTPSLVNLIRGYATIADCFSTVADVPIISILTESSKLWPPLQRLNRSQLTSLSSSSQIQSFYALKDGGVGVTLTQTAARRYMGWHLTAEGDNSYCTPSLFYNHGNLKGSQQGMTNNSRTTFAAAAGERRGGGGRLGMPLNLGRERHPLAAAHALGWMANAAVNAISLRTSTATGADNNNNNDTHQSDTLGELRALVADEALQMIAKEATPYTVDLLSIAAKDARSLGIGGPAAYVHSPAGFSFSAPMLSSCMNPWPAALASSTATAVVAGGCVSSSSSASSSSETNEGAMIDVTATALSVARHLLLGGEGVAEKSNPIVAHRQVQQHSSSLQSFSYSSSSFGSYALFGAQLCDSPSVGSPPPPPPPGTPPHPPRLTNLHSPRPNGADVLINPAGRSSWWCAEYEEPMWTCNFKLGHTYTLATGSGGKKKDAFFSAAAKVMEESFPSTSAVSMREGEWLLTRNFLIRPSESPLVQHHDDNRQEAEQERGSAATHQRTSFSFGSGGSGAKSNTSSVSGNDGNSIGRKRFQRRSESAFVAPPPSLL